MAMEINLTIPALLFPAIAILMLGYVNRYIGTASVIRTFKKDYDTGYKHVDVVGQLTVLRTRIQLSRAMLTFSAIALLLACSSMFLVFQDLQYWGKFTFGASLIGMIVSIFLSLYETSLSNKSLIVEINDVLKREHAKRS